MEYLTKLSKDDPSIATRSQYEGLTFTYPVKYYDFHIYYFAHNRASREESDSLRDKSLVEFAEEGKTGSVIIKKLPNDKVIGPHPTQFWEIDVCRPEVFIKVLSWIQLNHGSLSVLIHPQTGDDLKDHTERAMWLGPELPLFIDVFDKDAPIGIPEFGVRGGKRIHPDLFDDHVPLLE